MQRLWMIILAGLLPLVLCWLPGHADDEEQKPGRKYALLVGVQKYDGTGMSNLRYCENDVSRLAEVLRGEGYGYRRVVLLTRTEAQKNIDRDDILPTAENIREQLHALLEGCKAEDTILLGFAGHGVQLKKDGKFYFCPAKCNIDKPETLVSLDAIYDELKGCKAQAKILLVDACRNDPLDRRGEDDRLSSVTRPLIPDPPGGTVALFSCSKGQVARENEKLGHGYLFKFLIQGMEGDRQVVNARTGEVGWAKLAAYVADEVRDQVKEDYGPKGLQTPEIKGESRGLVLGRVAGDKGNEFLESKTLPGLKLKRIVAKGKSFTMGSPESEKDRFESETQHEVRFSQDYYLGVTHVTRGQFAAFAKDTDFKGGKWDDPGFEQSGDHPVVNVSWEDAQLYCKWLSKKDGRKYRLPTESEWEYACRAGTQTTYSFGNDEEKLGDYAWYSANSGKRTHPVAKTKPNAWGLYDMHGNALQWCEDRFGDYPRGEVSDPPGREVGPGRVYRGASWDFPPQFCRSSLRLWNVPTCRGNELGFRLAVSVRQ